MSNTLKLQHCYVFLRYQPGLRFSGDQKSVLFKASSCKRYASIFVLFMTLVQISLSTNILFPSSVKGLKP